MTENKPDEAPVQLRPVDELQLPPVDDDQDDDDVDQADSVKLTPGVTEDRATGLVAVYDTRELRFVTGTMSPDDERLDGLDVNVTRTGRYQLRRV